MDLFQHVAITGAIIFIGILSWIGIFFIAAYVFQWGKDTIKEHRRIKKAAKQDSWSAD